MSWLIWKYEKFHPKREQKYVKKLIEHSEKQYVKNRRRKVREYLHRIALIENAYVSTMENEYE